MEPGQIKVIQRPFLLLVIAILLIGGALLSAIIYSDQKDVPFSEISPSPHPITTLFTIEKLPLTLMLPSGWTTQNREYINEEKYILDLYAPSPLKDAANEVQPSVIIAYYKNRYLHVSNGGDITEVKNLEEYVMNDTGLSLEVLENLKTTVGGNTAYIVEQKDAVTVYTSNSDALYFITLTSADTYDKLNSDEKNILASITFTVQ